MAIFKCKMCGGNLEISDGMTVCECEYCGTTQTLPKLDDEKKANLFNRANRLRFNNEFDAAAGVFQSIVSEFPEEAEAYWGLCLCKYGIEYVDDPATAKKIPTCHRTSYDSIFDDGNFEQACENADAVSRKVYREEAKEIDRLQKAILDIAKNESPYDIFICYKETAEDGQRTKDSVLAQDMYDALTEKGYKVFFARITLEDKLGQEYEPYIFSALNSAKIMLAVGTDFEYFNAVWVKNEWSRFLDLMKKDKSKVLIPCYADIDAYDMPKEFKNLQGQDMGKVGFMQDLVRGVGKIIPPEKEQSAKQLFSQQSTINIDSLIQRAEIYLEDGEWNKINEICERILDIDPQNKNAYLFSLFAKFKVKSISEIDFYSVDLENVNEFKRALKFADDETKSQLYELLEKNHKITIQNKLIKVLKKRSRDLFLKSESDRVKSVIEKDHTELINAIMDVLIDAEEPLDYSEIMRSFPEGFKKKIGSSYASNGKVNSALRELAELGKVKIEKNKYENKYSVIPSSLTGEHYEKLKRKSEMKRVEEEKRKREAEQREREEEERRKQEEKQRQQEEEELRREEERTIRKERENRRLNNRCQYCGYPFKGVFKKVCSSCGKEKDY